MTHHATDRMNALVYRGPSKRKLEEVPKPQLLHPTDALVRMMRTTICGTDLHILRGDVPSVAAGRILGHEGIGVIEEVGDAVGRFRKGERVLISCITTCGTCAACRRGTASHCEQGGWVLGNTIDGTQAEFVRIPFADTSLLPIPPGADEDAMVLLSDVLPTGYECGVLNGCVQPGDDVAIIGAGPIGLATVLTARFFSPARIIVVDVDPHRLKAARRVGATHVINSSEVKAAEAILAITDGKGVAVAIEAVGIGDTFELCQDIVGVGGHIANVGVHGTSVTLHLEKLWSQNITITTGLVDAVTTPLLLEAVVAGRIEATALVTHHYALGDIMEAYDTFEDAANNRALKVILVSG